MPDNIELIKVIQTRATMEKYQDEVYLKLMKQLNANRQAIMSKDLGSEFVNNCVRDLAGEIIRNCFDTTSYNITIDQLVTRILHFSYEDEYDPLDDPGCQEQVRKDVLGYQEFDTEIADSLMQKFNMKAILREKDEVKEQVELDDNGKSNYAQLFTTKRKNETKNYKNSKVYDIVEQKDGSKTGKLDDEITGNTITTKTKPQNKNDFYSEGLEVDHAQSREGAKYNTRYVTEKGVEQLRDFWNSGDNFQMMEGAANSSKGDVRVCLVGSEIKYIDAQHDKSYDPSTDITYKATPEQLADATIFRWEMVDESREGKNSKKIETLKQKGYLDENGKVPKSVRQALIHNIRNSQNQESKNILKNTDYKVVTSDAFHMTINSAGKIIEGQIIYYAAPPLVYEVKNILMDKTITIENALEKIGNAGKRIGEYVITKLKDIFTNIAFSSIKKFVRSFMDILINLVKATVKKLLKIAKKLVLSTVDAVRIISNKDSSPQEKADSVVNLFGVTITSCVIETIFEILGDSLHIPEPFDDIIFGPLQILTTVICTNLTMLILKKADLFDVQHGFKMTQIRRLFSETEEEYKSMCENTENYTDEKINRIIEQARQECRTIYSNLAEMDMNKQSVRENLEKINKMFSMNIDFETEWLKFMGHSCI